VDDADEVCKAKYSAADDQTTKQTVAEVNWREQEVSTIIVEDNNVEEDTNAMYPSEEDNIAI
jgi:hypothetical protein